MNKKPNKAERLIYKALQTAIKEDKLRLYLDYGKINRPGSPVYDPWENLLPLLVPAILGLLLILAAGVVFGLLFIVAGIIVYSTYFKKKVYLRLISRTKNFITSGYENCQKLWEFGGIVLVNAANKKHGCVSPDGDWKEFVVQNYADYMTDTPQKDSADEKPEETAKPAA